MQKWISVLIAVMLALTFVGVSSAQGLSGKSNLELSEAMATVAPNSTLVLNYTMQLVNGTGNTTFIIIANGQQLSSSGVGVGLNPGSGTPTYSGQININVAANATPGTYGIVFETGGADPTSGPYNFTLTVSNASNQSSGGTTAPTTVPYSVGSTVPTTTAAQGSTGSSGYSSSALALVAILVVIVIAIIAVVALRSKKG